MTAPPPSHRSPLFLIVFVAALLCVSALVFISFATFQRMSAASRQEQSRLNLRAMREALTAFAKVHDGHLPSSLSEWLPRVDPKYRVNPTWPDDPGYVYIPGASLQDHDDTILVFENTPERKRKLGTFALLLNGAIVRLADAELTERLDKQKQAWKIGDHVWSPELITP